MYSARLKSSTGRHSFCMFLYERYSGYLGLVSCCFVKKGCRASVRLLSCSYFHLLKLYKSMKSFSRIRKWVTGVMMGLLVVGFTGCAASYNVITDYDKTTDFQGYKTWRWYQDQPVAKNDSSSTRRYTTFLDKRVKNAVEAEMQRRGFTKAAATETPDMLLAYDFTIENQTRVRPDFVSVPSIGIGYWYGYRYAYSYNRLYNTTTVQDYQEGTLILDIVDPSSNELIWRGSAYTTANERSLTDEKVQEIVTSILAKFPPQTNAEKATASR